MVRSPIVDVASLELPLIWEKEIQNIINDNHMLYVPWIESSPNYNTLRERLKEKGFTKLPMGASQMINLHKFGKIPITDISGVNIKKTMLQKRKR